MTIKEITILINEYLIDLLDFEKDNNFISINEFYMNNYISIDIKIIYSTRNLEKDQYNFNTIIPIDITKEKLIEKLIDYKNTTIQIFNYIVKEEYFIDKVINIVDKYIKKYNN